MKICVTSQGSDLDSLVDPRFGRCQYFIIVETDTMEYKVIENSNIAAGGGAGIQSAQQMVEEGIEIVLTGNCGPNAFRVFSQAGIKIVTGVSGSIRESVEKFKSGAVGGASSPSVEGHFGLGVGMGMGSGIGNTTREVDVSGEPLTSKAGISKSDELITLKEQAEQLKSQLDELMKRIKEIEED
jgi:predicted Fe-Mo cluster-binding NifX family protein